MLGDTMVPPSSSTQQPAFTTPRVPLPAEGISGWTLALIAIGTLTLIGALAVAVNLLFRRVKDQRKNHGEYRPQFEENMHAKNLPYISPPNIEGLI